jgi:hypothetical protein
MFVETLPTWQQEMAEQTITVNREMHEVVPFPMGAVVELQFPSQCSAHLGDTRLDDEDRKALFDGVMVKNITTRADGWHGWWRCPDHWNAYSGEISSKAAATPAEMLARGVQMVRAGTALIEKAANLCPIHHEARSLSGACFSCE